MCCIRAKEAIEKCAALRRVQLKIVCFLLVLEGEEEEEEKEEAET